jgi:hypothetical protein
MNWKDIAGSIAAYAPTLGAAIGGPAGSIAGMGVKALAGVFGISAADTDAETKVAEALKAMTPEQAMQIQNADKKFKKEMAQLGVDVFKLEIQDKASARNMFVSTGNITPMLLTFVLAGIAGVIVWMVFNSKLDGVDKTLVGTVIGYVFSELKQATAFWFGSSKGSQDKTKAMTKLG